MACTATDRSESVEQETGVAISSGGSTDAAPGTVGTDGAESSGFAAGSSEDTGSLKLDVGADDDPTTGPCVSGDCESTGCTAVDLLFVVDNSASMQPYQAALAQAFPSFAQAIVEGLAPGVNIHVGVTSTEMGYSSMGQNVIEYFNDQAVSCSATGDGDAPSASFYDTPDVAPSNTNGAQGRLYTAAGRPYFDIDTDAGPETVAELEAWFSAAAQIGEMGSQVEMSAAAAGWATDPANTPTNQGFLRDEGAVLVLFFVQDEHDQTPDDAATTILQQIGAAKSACGGFDCVVGGGFVNEDCLSLTPLGQLFDAFGGDEVVTRTLPAPEAVTPQTFEDVLRDTLAQVIIDTCNEIEPPG